MKRWISNIFRIGLPVLIAAAIMWWMYRRIDWNQIQEAMESRRCWTWILLSMPFGISAQVFRALRWKQVLDPLGYRTRTGVLINSIFLSYGSSLAIPRSGEVLRCGVVKKYDGVDFSKLVGSVVTERVIDMAMVATFSLVTLLLQIPVFVQFMDRTGMSLGGIMAGFTTAGYMVTLLCGLLAAGMAVVLMHRVHLFGKLTSKFRGFAAGLTSVRNVSSPFLFLAYSVGIWLSYYLHFYIAFQCFEYTANLGPMCALVAFVAGCFAVLVPTPNGAGPWHFAVKTVLVLYGVAGNDAAIFAFVVHTLQTLLVALLGLWSLAALGRTKINS
ncbi:MAG: flippase-like domain-containing protein [Bacteroidaceae bacterium]|nr:flippase-like domain-containing protein [Bacteroidaceae bacterium]